MPQQNPDITLALDRIKARSAVYQEFYDYYEGRHQMTFSSEKFKNKFGKRLQKLHENLCRTVVKAPASRLEVIGFQSESEDIQKIAWEIWKRNNMPLEAGKAHREAFKTGDSFAIVWPDKKGKARIYPQTAANVVCWKDAETGEITKAAKRWLGSDKKFYLTLYYPDRIEKYISKNALEAGAPDSPEFIPRAVTGEKFPLANPFGRVPVFQFTFDEEANDASNSILTDVIPLNDALNKAYVDIFVAQEFNAIRQRWMTGIQFEKDDETGKPIIPYDFDSQAWNAEGAEAKFGEFSDAQLEQMLKVKQECVRDIALVSGIPPSYFNLDTTDFPSGEALRKIEARFTAIVQDAQRSFGDAWGEAMGFALQIEGGTEKEIEVQWTDAAPIGESEQLDNALKKKNLGWSIEQIQRDFGLSDKQITDMAAESAEREKTKMENAAKFFDGGPSLTE
jgi:hypothetical protein